MYKSIEHLDLTSVPYKGNQQALVDLRGGQIQILFETSRSCSRQVKEAPVRGLAVSSAKRSAVVPDLPTMQRAGVPGYELVGWIAAFAPRRRPAPIVKRSNEEMNKALADKDFIGEPAGARRR
jgi:tripartite-type tricarboxylate transporter receptor subunit TctC